MASIGGFVRRRPLSSGAAGLAVVLAAGLALSWARGRKPQYVTAAVTRGNIQRSVSTTGALNPVVTVQVGSYVSGTIKSLSCDYNTEVVIGQPCATIDPVPFQLIVEQDQAQVGTAQAQLKKDQASLLYAKTAYERDAKLVAEGTVSQDTVDSEKSSYDQAVAQIGLDQASIIDKKAALKAAQVNLAYTNIVSPVIGTVITRSIDVGQTVAASLQSPTLFLIAKDLTQMQVDTNVSEADVGDVRLGQDAFFTVQAFAGKTFHGQIRQIRHGPITVQNVVTYDIVIGVPNPDRSLFPGMTADTHIVIDERKDVLRVPLPAVRFTPQGFGTARKASAPKSGVKSEGEVAGQVAAGPGIAGAQSEEDKSERKRERRLGKGSESGERRPEGKGEDHPGRGGEGSGAKRFARKGGEHPSQVWVLENGKLRAVAVMTGIDDGALVEVSGEGLKVGDRVVVNEITPESRADQRRGPTLPNQNQNQFRPPGPRI